MVPLSLRAPGHRHRPSSPGRFSRCCPRRPLVWARRHRCLHRTGRDTIRWRHRCRQQPHMRPPCCLLRSSRCQRWPLRRPPPLLKGDHPQPRAGQEEGEPRSQPPPPPQQPQQHSTTSLPASRRRPFSAARHPPPPARSARGRRHRPMAPSCHSPRSGRRVRKLPSPALLPPHPLSPPRTTRSSSLRRAASPRRQWLLRLCQRPCRCRPAWPGPPRPAQSSRHTHRSLARPWGLACRGRPLSWATRRPCRLTCHRCCTVAAAGR